MLASTASGDKTVDLKLTEEQQLIQDTAKQFASEQLAPLAAQIDQQENRKGFLNNLSSLAQLGFMGLNVKAEYGGSEAGVIAFSLAITELAKGCASTAVTVSVSNLVAEVIQAMGTTSQKQTYLPKLCSGEYAAGSFCLTEANAGSDPANMDCKAGKTDSGWSITGSKLFITSAEYAGVYVVWAVTDSTARKGKGISCFLIPADRAGISVANAEHKMGQHGSATNEVIFNQCQVNQDDLLGELNQGYKIAVTELAGGRIGIGSLALGLGLAAMDYATQYVSQRQQFGQAIADFQGIQWMLSDTYTNLEAAKLLLYQAAYQKQCDQDYGKAASMAKLFATEKANAACYTALQLMGGAGYLQDHPLERYSRDVRITTIYEGTSQIQKVIIAKAILQQFR